MLMELPSWLTEWFLVWFGAALGLVAFVFWVLDLD